MFGRLRRARVRTSSIIAAVASMSLVASCGGDGDADTSTSASTEVTTEAAPETTEAAPETTEAASETTEAAPETTEAAPETTEAADDSTGAAVGFDLTTEEMSADDVAALADLSAAVAADPANLGPAAPGVLFGVWDPDRGVHLTAAGLSEIDTETAMTPDLSFRIGSITKTFTATAVLLLVDDGQVDLDEPVATYTGDLTAVLPGGDTATVRQLLGMMSGFPEYTERPTGPFGQALLDPAREFTAEELVAAAAENEPTSTDGVTYVNTNYIVLGELIANVSGMSYGDFVQQRILDPVGLENTIIPDPTVTAPTTTHGYLNAGGLDFDGEIPADLQAAAPSGLDVTEMSTSVGGAAGNGVSTLEDLAAWAATDFGNALLSEPSQAARLDSMPADNIIPGSEYGLGLQVLGDWHGHGGEILGWESQLWANPTTGQVAVVNANACCGLVGFNLLTVSLTFPDDPEMAALRAVILGG
jgi:D-alanyl-D-alanine carboxypeptidase